MFIKEIGLSSPFGSKPSLDSTHKALSLSIHSLAMAYEFFIHSSHCVALLGHPCGLYDSYALVVLVDF
jgi:hypothetical protein